MAIFHWAFYLLHVHVLGVPCACLATGYAKKISATRGCFIWLRPPRPTPPSPRLPKKEINHVFTRQQMPNMLQFTDFVGICVAWKNLQDTTPNVESICSRFFYCLLVLPMLYINYKTLISLIYVLSLLEVQTIHLAQGLRSYHGLIPHLAEGTMATMSKDGCKANPGCALSLRPPMDIAWIFHLFSPPSSWLQH